MADFGAWSGWHKNLNMGTVHYAPQKGVYAELSLRNRMGGAACRIHRSGLGAISYLSDQYRPIPVAQGFPVRLLVPHMYGYKSVKWLVGIKDKTAETRF